MSSDIRMEDEYSLSQQSLDQFRHEGWAPLPGLISRELAGEIMHRLYASDNTVAPTATEKWMTATDYQRVLRMHDGMAWKDDWFKALALSRRMSQLALQLIGEDEGLFIHDMSFIKTGDDGGATPFHQDFPHWPFDRTGAFTIWIALTDMTEDMGTLQFLSGSHQAGPLGRFSRSVGDDMVKAKPWLLEKYRKAGGQPLRAGDATVHVDLMVHGAGGNTTGRDRAAYTLRYMPTDVLYTGAPHRHFEKFGLTPGDDFADSPLVPHIHRRPA
ncbi:phytanoyl-CoA dioxygenase family protein [Variovorax sp. PBL-E5]|uniref:phytanoyl-CoA dioxygenase family protein n=1 Tax=Variovorax sp. PBL-E5 TaxID=434014 RepID=UPI00131991F3|nr:phytanoyl-CoA dioxygenase family protein [Variovorax sp. PBL-E5]VTU25285.1 Phytanoyl-CoA dioxygenase (PhyH) [Variovorax sp. PBL-E5]